MTKRAADDPTKRRVLVVGASSSVGRAVARCFAERGDQVVATYHQTPLPPDLRVGHGLSLDLADDRSREAFLAEIAAQSRRFELVIILPSILPGRDLGAYDEALADRVMRVNVVGQAMLIRGLREHLAREAQILMMSSISGIRGSYDPIYAASKAAVLGLVSSLAVWLAPAIRINAIAPGLIEDSAMYHAMEPERRRVHRERTPTGRLLRADDLAAILWDLSQPHWSQLNGACIDLNGGEHVSIRTTL